MIARMYVVLASLVVLCATVSRADPFCAVKVRVTTREGSPVLKASARLIDPAGKTVQQAQVSIGEVRFCDFEFGLHSIVIDAGECGGSVVVNNVRAVYGREQVIDAVLNSCVDRGDGFGNGCSVYVRVKDNSGRPLGDVQISERGYKGEKVTDRFGRVALVVRFDQSGLYTFSKPGHESETVRLSCGQGSRRDEASVILKTP